MTDRGDKVHGIMSFAIGLINDEDRPALQQQLSTFIQDHPTFRIEVKAFEDGLIVGGDDEMELMDLREKIAPEYEANMCEVTIGYKESIRRQAEAEGKYIRQTGASGNYGQNPVIQGPLCAKRMLHLEFVTFGVLRTTRAATLVSERRMGQSR